ncbi:MAG: ribosome recycling factor [Cytophagales bacterium]|nr:ribosome recycling factor [Cytophagales bacterium]
MDENIQLYLDECDDAMEKAIKHLAGELTKIRAGRATPSMLDGITVLYYGANTPLNQVSSISTTDARTLSIKPFEKNIIGEIEKAIRNSDLGFNPQNNGEVVLIAVPPLTEERRKQLVKQVKHEGENAKVSIRNIRKDINEEIKKLQKEGVAEDEAKKGEAEVQKYTDSYVAKVDDLCSKKEVEIMTV